MNNAEPLVENICALDGAELTSTGDHKDSQAHILPSALGGRLKPYGILCSTCNTHLAKYVDKPIIDCFPADALKILEVSKDRNYKDGSAKLRAADTKEEWRIDKDSSVITPAKGKFLRTQLEDGSTSWELNGDEKTLRSWYDSQRPKLNISFEEFLAHGSRQVDEAPILNLGIKGVRTDTVRRFAWSAAALFAAYRLRVKLPEWQKYISKPYVPVPRVYPEVPFTGFSPGLISFGEEYGESPHAVVLWSNSALRELYGYVQIFGAFGVCVVLCDHWDVEVAESYCVNPWDGRQGTPNFSIPAKPLFLEFGDARVQVNAKNAYNALAQRLVDIGFAASTRIDFRTSPE